MMALSFIWMLSHQPYPLGKEFLSIAQRHFFFPKKMMILTHSRPPCQHYK